METLASFLTTASEFAHEIYIDGSFTTSIRAPSDVDIALVLPSDFDLSSGYGKLISRYQRAKKTLKLQIFVFVDGEEDTDLRNMINYWCTDRDDNTKGIVRLEKS